MKEPRAQELSARSFIPGRPSFRLRVKAGAGKPASRILIEAWP